MSQVQILSPRPIHQRSVSGHRRTIRENLCHEALRLGRLLAALMPQEPEVLGLLSLMLLIDSRRAARLNHGGGIATLRQQNRALWNRDLIAEGEALLRVCLQRNEPGPYQLQAAINALHCRAASADAVDWTGILRLYEQLQSMQPTPIVALNRAVALAEVQGPQTALELVDSLGLQDYYLFHAIRADLLGRLNRRPEAVAAYGRAMARTENALERDLLQQRLLALGQKP